jgi:LysR family transcriptional activator of mexEF-oprN operon
VSYNGDLRGIVEDMFGKARKVRCSISSFANLGAVIDGTAMLATVPETVAEQVRATRPHLRTRPLPLPVRGSPVELLWPAATDDDAACVFARAKIAAIASRVARPAASRRRARMPSRGRR